MTGFEKTFTFDGTIDKSTADWCCSVLEMYLIQNEDKDLQVLRTNDNLRVLIIDNNDENPNSANGYEYTKELKTKIANSPTHTLSLKDSFEYIKFYGLNNLIDAQGDIRFVGQVAVNVLDKFISGYKG